MRCGCKGGAWQPKGGGAVGGGNGGRELSSVRTPGPTGADLTSTASDHSGRRPLYQD